MKLCNVLGTYNRLRPNPKPQICYNLRIIKLSYAYVLAGMPILVFGAENTIEHFIGKFLEVIINPFITLLFAGAFLYFFWGLFQMMVELPNGGDGKAEKNHMLWGIVDLTIMFTVWGIIGIITRTIGVESPETVIAVN